MAKKKLKVTGEKLVLMDQALNQIGAMKGNNKFAIAVARNLAITRPIVEAIGKNNEASDEYKEFEGKVKSLFEQNAEPTESGQMHIPEGKWSEYRDGVNALKEAHKDVVAKREAEIAENEKTLKDELDDEIEFFTIEEKLLPKEVTGNQLYRLIELIQ